jgi:hypothetical protein
MVPMKRLIFALASAALLMGVAGCGQAQSQAKTKVLCSFEKIPDPSASRQVYDLVESLKKPDLPVDDYGWATSGYVEIEPFNKYATQGKTSAKVRFTVPADFKKADKKPKVWEAGMTLSTETPTKLDTTDWSAFKLLAVDVYNTEDTEYQARLRVVDAYGNVTETAQLIKPKGKSYMYMEVTRLAEARLAIRDIKLLTLYMDTVNLPKDPVLYFDNVRLTSGTLR